MLEYSIIILRLRRAKPITDYRLPITLINKNMRILVTFLFFILISTSLVAQEKVLAGKPYHTLDSTPGFTTINELIVGFGLGDTSVPYSKIFFGLTTTNGYQINRNFVVAGGTGVFFYNDGTLVPLFADFRYRMNIDPVTPCFFIDAGGLLDFTDLNSSKIFVSGGAGAQYALSKQLAINGGAGLMIQSLGHRDAFITLRAGVTYKF